MPGKSELLNERDDWLRVLCVCGDNRSLHYSNAEIPPGVTLDYLKLHPDGWCRRCDKCPRFRETKAELDSGFIGQIDKAH